jgi:phage tail-like protein
MATLQKDIYRGFKFTVTIAGNDFKRAAFQKVSGLKKSVEVVEYREGNMPDRMEKFSGMMTYDTLTLERGVSYDDDFNTWFKSVSDTATSGTPNTPPNSGGADFGVSSYRKNLTIKLYNKQAQVVKTYKVLGAWPSEYEIGDLDATSNDVLITTLTLQHHGIEETDMLSEEQ